MKLWNREDVQPHVSLSHSMTIAFAVYPKSSLPPLLLDTFWAWLVPREPLVAEEKNPEAQSCRYTKRRQSSDQSHPSNKAVE